MFRDNYFIWIQCPVFCWCCRHDVVDGDVLPALIFGALCLRDWMLCVVYRSQVDTVVRRRHIYKQCNTVRIQRKYVTNLVPSENQSTNEVKIDGNDDESDGGGRWLMNENSMHGGMGARE